MMFYTYGMRGCGPKGFAAMWGLGQAGRGHFRGRRGEGRGRRRVFDSGELRLVLLKLIADSPRHGYDLIREIESLTNGAYAPSPGVIYPTLTLLEDMGLIAESQGEGARKQFEATDGGREHLAERAEQVEALFARLQAMGAEREKTDGAPIRRAMGNLTEAMRMRLSRDDVTAETLHEVAALLDEATRKIERL